MHSLAGSLTGKPPFLSPTERVMLRYPAIMIFSRLCMPRKVFKESQQILFSDSKIGTYKLKIITWWSDYLWSNLVKIHWVLLSSSIRSNFELSQKVPIPPEAPLELIAFP